MKVAAYIRTATNDLESYKQQINAIEHYCNENGYMYSLFEDTSSSGLNKGNQLTELINKVNEYDLIITESVERLTRNATIFYELENTFKDKLVIIRK